MNKLRIRNAVGAIVYQGSEYLLIYKVKSISTGTDIPGHWDFPKGGLQETDKDLEAAVLRELEEETGSRQYRVVSKYDRKINFEFPEGHKYDCQETNMFLVEYLGDRSDLKPQDEEISKVGFFSKEELRNLLTLSETREFMKEVTW